MNLFLPGKCIHMARTLQILVQTCVFISWSHAVAYLINYKCISFSKWIFEVRQFTWPNSTLKGGHINGDHNIKNIKKKETPPWNRHLLACTSYRYTTTLAVYVYIFGISAFVGCKTLATQAFSSPESIGIYSRMQACILFTTRIIGVEIYRLQYTTQVKE